MATRDHKARTRPSVPADGTLTDSYVDPSYFDEVPVTPHPCEPLDIALAILTLARLRRDCEHYRRELARSGRAGPLDQLFSADVTAALSIAIGGLERMAFEHEHVPTVNA